MNAKPGDLAIVVDDGGKFENLGLIVNVISYEGSFFGGSLAANPHGWSRLLGQEAFAMRGPTVSCSSNVRGRCLTAV
jgi:hypothetical protein